MTVRVLPFAGSLAMALVLTGCTVAGIKPLPGNRSGEVATAAIASFAPTPAGHMPDAAAVPTASSSLLSAYAGGASGQGQFDGLIAHYAEAYNVPEHLIRRVIVRESGYNAGARNGPYYGLMQISHATARGMGFSGSASDLLDAETNLRFAVRYLAGAYVTAGGNDDRAVQFYARGYYYDAKKLGLLDQSGLR